MEVAVIGGTGEAGGAIAAAIERRGSNAIILSRHASADAREHRPVDVTTGDGLAAGLAGVDAVVHAANARRDARGVLVDGTARLIRAAAEARVGHLVSLSIVGCEQVPIGYYRAKAEQDALVERAELPWTVVPATQFHSLFAGLFAATRRFGWLPGGSSRFQPVAVAELAESVSELVLRPAAGRAPSVVGPRTETLADLAAAYKRATGSRALIAPPPLPPRIRRPLAGGALGDTSVAGVGPPFEHWLSGPIDGLER